MHLRSFLLLAAPLLSFSAVAAVETIPPAEPLPGALTEWTIGPAGRPNILGHEAYLDGRKPAERDARTADAGADGWVDLAAAAGAREGAAKVWARTTFAAPAAGPRPFAVACPGALSLYLNGQPVLRLDHRTAAGAAAHVAPDTVFLPLVAGANELAVMVTAESAAAWRFQVRDASAIRQDPRLETVWERHDGALGGPESVAYDAKRAVFYVSGFSSGAIARVSAKGEVLSAAWVAGLKRPTGLKLHGDRVHAIDRSGLVVIDPETATIVDRVAIDGAGFANDLAIADDGTVYVTDSSKGGIYRIAGGKSEVWIAGSELPQPNGILLEKTRLLVAVTSDGTIKAIDLATKEITAFARISSGAIMDGLVSDGGRGYLFSDYFGRLYHADAAGKAELLLDRRSPRQFIADFEYVPAENLLIIPSLYDERLTALRWHPTPPPAAKE